MNTHVWYTDGLCPCCMFCHAKQQMLQEIKKANKENSIRKINDRKKPLKLRKRKKGKSEKIIFKLNYFEIIKKGKH